MRGERRIDIRLISASSFGGGSERVCLRLANQWAQEGKTIELLLVHGIGIESAGLDRRVIVRVGNKTRVRWALVWLIARLRGGKNVPTLVFGFDVGFAIGLLKRFGLLCCPAVYREWNLPELNIPPARHWVYRHAMAYFDGIVAQTTYAANSLRSLGAGHVPIVCITNPVDKDFGKTVVLRQLPAAAPNELRLLVVARLSAEKRIDRLLGGIAHCVRQGQPVTLIIAGEGIMRAELGALARDLGIDRYVHFVGWIRDVRGLFRQCDLFVLSSAYEGMPNALLEAILSGCRVLSSGGGGVRELLDRISLPDCYLEEGDFGENFPRRVRDALSISIERWSDAECRLRAMTDIRRIAAEYYRFCSDIAEKTSH